MLGNFRPNLFARLSLVALMAAYATLRATGPIWHGERCTCLSHTRRVEMAEPKPKCCDREHPPAPEPQSPNDSGIPPHDSDDCPICQWLQSHCIESAIVSVSNHHACIEVLEYRPFERCFFSFSVGQARAPPSASA